MELGKKQTLYVVKKVEFGVYLGDSPEAGAESRVLLPAKQVPEGAEKGTAIRVFLYKCFCEFWHICLLFHFSSYPQMELIYCFCTA